MADAGWINHDIILEALYVFSPFIMYSPSKRYSMMRIHRLHVNNILPKLMIIDLYKNKSRELQMEEWTNVCYWYWLDETTISVFNEDNDKHYSHYVYSYDVNDQQAKLELIRKTRIPFLMSIREDIYNDNQVRNSTNCVNRLVLYNQEYLLVRTMSGILCPYDITAMGPLMPPLKIKTDVQEAYRKYCYSNLGYSFAYKNYIYLCVADNENTNGYIWMLANYLKKEVRENDLIERQAILEEIGDRKNEANLKKKIFNPKVLNKGLYKNYFIDGYTMWQDGPIILFSSRKPSGDRLIWVLNLEKETIMEQKIDIKFKYATIYRGFLHLWTTIPNETNKTEKIASKFIFLRYSVPKLSDICTIRLMSQNKLKLQ